GFKNNQAYDRMWEARKIWGSIVNDSRTWGMRIVNFAKSPESKKELIYRHIAWLYMHRQALLRPTAWEQVSADGIIGDVAKGFSKKYGLGQVKDDISLTDIRTLLSEEEAAYLKSVANPAVQLLHRQSADIKNLKDSGAIDTFEHLQLENLLQNFNTYQGQNERIKKFPFPRDYSTMSRAFIYIFVFLLPFSLFPELLKIGPWEIWVGVPAAVLIGMLFFIMEDVGDYNENPFMATPHAMPMLSISRNIEIDLREMLKDEHIPQPIQSVNGVLM
ncbi:MAG TPA: bestrophin family ion channel, partial [Cyclobacteriaceae bacterium]|nr:bestrophin family ion channel [Cyclobacteriaceae bacterium]